MLDGGGGEDILDYSKSDAAIIVNFVDATVMGGHAEGDTIISMERIWASNFADTFVGDGRNDFVSGLAGADVLDGGAGDDRLWGNEGDDNLTGGSGADGLVGDAGADRLVGGGGADRLQGGEGDDELRGGGG